MDDSSNEFNVGTTLAGEDDYTLWSNKVTYILMRKKAHTIVAGTEERPATPAPDATALASATTNATIENWDDRDLFARAVIGCSVSSFIVTCLITPTMSSREMWIILQERFKPTFSALFHQRNWINFKWDTTQTIRWNVNEYKRITRLAIESGG